MWMRHYQPYREPGWTSRKWGETMPFANQVVVVSGAGAGIGKGIATEFAKAGARVAIVEVNPSSGRSVADELQRQGCQAMFVQTDVSNTDSVGHAVETIAKMWGVIDIVINNAGVAMWKGIKDLSSEEWDRVLNVNLKGIFLMSKHCIPHMARSAVKSIINIASVHANHTIPNYDAYAASKGGVTSLTRSMALSLKEDGIRVNGICPGFIDTEMFRSYMEGLEHPEEYMNYVLSIHTVNRIGTPRDIANLCMFLSSDDAYFVNGEVITIDGGVSIQLKH